MKHLYNIKADTHCHTVASTHAYSTATENAKHAASMGLDLIALTDHGPTLPDAPHPWHFFNLKVLPRVIEGVIILRGIEANIKDTNGTLDLEERYLDRLDWVIASFHNQSYVASTKDEHTKALLAMTLNPHVDLFGHLDAPSFPFHIKEVVKACKETNKFIEINNSSFTMRPGGEEICKNIALTCAEYGVPVIINSDAHYCKDVGKVDRAIELLRNIDFPPELVLNLDCKKILEHVKQKHNEDLIYLLANKDMT